MAQTTLRAKNSKRIPGKNKTLKHGVLLAQNLFIPIMHVHAAFMESNWKQEWKRDATHPAMFHTPCHGRTPCTRDRRGSLEEISLQRLNPAAKSDTMLKLSRDQRSKGASWPRSLLKRVGQPQVTSLTRTNICRHLQAWPF